VWAWGLQLAPNATRILRQWDLLDDVIAAGVLPRRLVLKDAVDGTELTSLELGEDFVRRYGAPYVVIHRSDLLAILEDACEQANVELYFGPGCHLVQYPLRRGEMLNTVAVFASPAYRRGESEWGGPEELDAAFAGTCHQVRQGLAWLWRDRRWPMYDRPPIQNWTTGRFALMGDAAHPMLQYLAQGAGQAIEDAYCLSVQIAKNRAGTEPDWTQALAGYQAERAPRTARVQTTARSWGELWHCDGLTRSLRNVLLTDRDRRDYRYVDWLYLA
jgi:2-polyprenyl-6-methoxyphenol hydroxylase-like FAD-dependent oxidoreductase